MKQLTIRGMHCAACSKLITLELSELGLDRYLDRFELEEGNKGRLFLKEDISIEDLDKIKASVNSLKDYSVD
ncbi:MAG: hypothetical protein HYY51_04390 [Candidatus Magasanikbacteria bacterium]|nr:hypothetical protein [Candidatus Magasanikbacteria bacterium]